MNIQQSYNNWSAQYDTNLNKTRDLEAVSLRETLQDIPFNSCLEIGCGTGKNTVWLLQIAGHLLAVDLSEGMLALAKEKVTAPHVQFVQADITNAEQCKNFDQYDAILIARVLHFLTPEKMELAVKHLFLLLKPGGRIFVIAITPYVKRFQKFIPEYEQRLKNGEQYPGYVKSLRDYVDTTVTTPSQIQNIHEGSFLFLDVHTLQDVFERNGFKIIECHTAPLSYKSNSWSYDGREDVILIAKKAD